MPKQSVPNRDDSSQCGECEVMDEVMLPLEWSQEIPARPPQIHHHQDGPWVAVIKQSAAALEGEFNGKYLFFSSSPVDLMTIAHSELRSHGFERAKISLYSGSGQDYVLCLYAHNDERKRELADRNRRIYVEEMSLESTYRYWKSNADTLAGRYSDQFVGGLTAEQRAAHPRLSE